MSPPGDDATGTEIGAATPRALLAALSGARPFKRLLAELDTHDSRPLVGGLTGSLLAVTAGSLLQTIDRPVLVLVAGEQEAEAVAGDLELLGFEGMVRLLPDEEADFAGRLRIVGELSSNAGPRCLVSSVRALVDPVPDIQALSRQRLEVVRGAQLDRDDVVSRLTKAGFQREGTVVAPGTYSVRGDVLDVFTPQDKAPLRIEFFGDAIEGLRRFDPASQISFEILERASMDLLLEGSVPSEGTLTEHLLPETLVVSRDQERLREALERHLARYEEEEQDLRARAWEGLRAFNEVVGTQLRAPAAEAINLGGRVIAPEGTSFEEAVATLERVSRGKAVTLLCFDTEPEHARFFEIISEVAGQGGGKGLERRPIVARVGRLQEGFHSPLLGIAAVSHHELFATPQRRRPAPELEAVESRAIESFAELREGDFVVHLSHGIARFTGLRREEKGGAAQDFLVLEFRDEVTLLVPAVRIDLVQKYLGGRGEEPVSSRLGGSSWRKKKEAVASAVTDMATELLELHAIRERSPGIAHPPDSPWQQEFEAAFPFVLTGDQARALEAIKRDMEVGRPMERLICGDVGFGKTEVAMRAAFKCVMGGRQVAVLVPTTVLAQQHWNVFRERMSDYPVAIECLSRFRTRKEQERVVEQVSLGAVDIVIGTHRLLQSDVGFKDLGLLVIDEEQRFGVVHKETLRRLRKNVDVLVLSATPIPRTLHQALLGIRDISSLQQAPRGRHAVETRVVPREDGLIRAGILRELDREGQVFFVHNRVESIHRIAQKLEELVPEARFLIAHGQMPERLLESTMLAFLEGKADVLVCTSIIESGLDIPTVNTIFVDQAHMFGLSDLHQLRGRVGRYHHQAHATFMIGRDRVISEIAEKRLRAIEEFAELGAGFQISMRDMEIRGVGNILGSEQSGHIAAVGYELYCRLLESAGKRLKNEELIMPREVEINLDFTAFLPDAYIPDRRQRIEIYRKLGRAVRDEQFRAVLDEMRDRFGAPPDQAREFLLVARIRALLEEHKIHRLEWIPENGLMLRAVRMPRVAQSLRAGPEDARLIGRDRVLLVHPEPFSGPAEVLEFLRERLPASTRERQGAGRPVA